jgi:hypothetical protein
MAQSVEEAGRLYREALDASGDQRRQIEEDLAFTDPADPQQWEPEIKRQREADPGGIRPCLVFDQIGQYISNVTGNIERQPPSMHALPVDGGADKLVAEQLDGFFRHIEYQSRGQQHYMTAELSAARAGVGYLIVRPEYINRALNWQEPRISSEGDPLRVVFDPWSVELDGSDATFGFVRTPYSFREFSRRWPKAEKINFGDEDRCQVKDERESITVAEGWWVEDQRKNMILCQDMAGNPGDRVALSEDDFWLAAKQYGVKPEIYGTFEEKARVVRWARMSGTEFLDKETEYPADSIGIVPVYGYVSYRDGRLKYCGMGRRARNPQQAYNYHRSEMQAYMGQAPKSPWTVPVRAIAGLETLWDRASVDSRAYLPYHDVDEQGNPIAAPSRAQVSINLANHAAEAEVAKQDIQSALGMYQANLGAPSNETSGVAIDSRKEQGESSTANFPAHLKGSVGQVGRIIVQMIPRLIDTRRQIRILGVDMTPGAVTLDPKQTQPVRETQQGLSINPNIGRYDVRVVAGASFATQRTQAQAAFTELMRGSPEMMPIVAPFWAQTLDIPNADKLAQAFAAMAPAPVKAILQPQGQEQGPTTAELMQQIEQLKGALHEAINTAHEAEQDLDECQAKLEDKSEEIEAQRQKLEVDQYNAETQRLKVTGANEEQIKAIVADLVNQMLTSPQPLGDERNEGPGPDGSAPHEMAEGEPASADMQPLPGDLGEDPTQPAPAEGME